MWCKAFFHVRWVGIACIWSKKTKIAQPPQPLSCWCLYYTYPSSLSSMRKVLLQGWNPRTRHLLPSQMKEQVLNLDLKVSKIWWGRGIIHFVNFGCLYNVTQNTYQYVYSCNHFIWNLNAFSQHLHSTIRIGCVGNFRKLKCWEC